jgi:predicted AAA+ superfamily ATPase
LWLGFHNGSQDQYFDMIRGYAAYHGLTISDQELIAEAREWSMTRGGRSGRVAWQFIQDLAGRLGVKLKEE